MFIKLATGIVWRKILLHEVNIFHLIGTPKANIYLRMEGSFRRTYFKIIFIFRAVRSIALNGANYLCGLQGEVTT